MSQTWQRLRSGIVQPLPLTALLLLVIVVGGRLAVGTIRNWREDVIAANMALTATTAHRLATDAQEFLGQLPVRSSADGTLLIAVPRDSLDLELTRISTTAFAAARGLKGGFWVLQEGEFLGYANPWSPPPAPAFGPPPRSYPVILGQVNETIQSGQVIVRLHEFESVSVSGAVFPLATVPVRRDGQLIAVAWARIHIERELPAIRLSRYLNVTAFVAITAFLVALLAAMHQRREIRSLNERLQLMERDPSFRMESRRGMFGSIRVAINTMVDALEAEHRERRLLEDQLHQQDKMAALGNLLAGVAHEVKTPLAILKTRVQIWQRDLKRFSQDTGQPSPLSDDSMQIVLDEINRLAHLLRRLLYFSRPVRKDIMHPVDLDDLIRYSVLATKPRIVQKRLDLELDLAAGGAEILGDPDSLHQVFLNILTNSIDMVAEGGAMSIATRVEDDRIVCDLEDTGPGIAADLRARVFTPFYTTRHGGSGLGLAIAYEIVQAHEGAIAFVDPRRHGGAHCRVGFPILKPQRESSDD